MELCVTAVDGARAPARAWRLARRCGLL